MSAPSNFFTFPLREHYYKPDAIVGVWCRARVCRCRKYIETVASRFKIQFLFRFTQKSKNAAGKEMEKKSLINIVDLAGR